MALVLEVEVNGERFTLAGEESMSVLSAHVTAVGKLGSETAHSPRRPDERRDIELRVGGLTRRGDGRKDEHLRWGPRKSLDVGDVVRITLQESSQFDQPVDREPSFPSSTGSKTSMRKRYNKALLLLERLERIYGPLEEKRARADVRRSMRLPR